jgi:membrane-bound hydrogenase subunit beta
MSELAIEEGIRDSLVRDFPPLEGKIRIQRRRRVWVDVALGEFRSVFERAIKDYGFTIMCIITGLDEGENLGFLYHIANTDGVILNLHTTAPKADPVIKTVTDLFPAAHIYERELVDLLGAKVDGLAPGNRYPLPDGWPEGQYPLRKDWKPENAGTPAQGA